MEHAGVNTENIKSIAEELSSHITDYVETSLKLGAAGVVQKTTTVATVMLTAVLVTAFCFFVLLFAGIGVAIWLGELWDNTKAGYFVVAVFYLSGSLLLIVLHRAFIFPFVRDHIIKKIYE